MVHPPSSVSFITSGSKSTETPFGSSDFSGCLRGFFTCTPTKRKHPPHSTAVGMELRIVVVELFGLHFSSSRHEEPRSLQARSCSSTSARPQGRKADTFSKATNQEWALACQRCHVVEPGCCLSISSRVSSPSAFWRRASSPRILSAPRSARNLAASSCPLEVANSRGLSPKRSTALILAPLARR